MQVQEFIEALQVHPSKNLSFQINSEAIPSGYHITEVKDVHLDTVDCGGKTNHWRETLIQLWTTQNSDQGDRSMQVDKALSILNKVQEVQPMDNATELKFEYRHSQEDTVSIFSVGAVEVTDDQFTVHLGTVPTQCKAATRTEGACCASTGCCS